MDRWFQRYLLVPLGLAAATWALYNHRNAVVEAITVVVGAIDPPAESTSAAALHPLPSESTIVRLNARPGLDVPVRVVTRWSVTDPRFGQVSVYVPVGKTPREALTIELAERGFQVLRTPE